MGVNFMAKYSYEFKSKVVHAYLQRKGSYTSLAEYYKIASESTVEKWVAAYQKLGDAGIRRSRQKKNYPFQFKLHAVELYLSTETSYKNLAFSLGMKEPSVLADWVQRYRAVGIDGLKTQRKGRRPKVSKPRIPKKLENEQQAYLKQLEEENLHLRIENAYLKELRRLRLAEEAQRKKQGSSTASEDHSD
jgi:transposase